MRELVTPCPICGKEMNSAVTGKEIHHCRQKDLNKRVEELAAIDKESVQYGDKLRDGFNHTEE